MLRAESLSMVFARSGRRVEALSGVSFCVDPGEMVAVVGPSGSGKSTLLNALGALMRPTSGRVLVDGRDVYSMSSGARRKLRRDSVGFVFQTFHLVPYLTAFENVSAALSLRGRSAGGCASEARAMLDRLGLADRADHLPADLSVGERQRVALARAAAGSPGLLLADEPTGNLDPENARMIRSHLAEFRDEGRAVVLVTHDPSAFEMANRIVRLEKGRVVG